MATPTQVTPGMTIAVGKKLYRVESCVRVAVKKGTPFIKTKLRDLSSDEIIEKNFKPSQAIKEVSVSERQLEFLYLEGKDYLFLDIDDLKKIFVSSKVVGENAHYLKEGIQVKATLYGDTVFSLELPMYLELTIVKTEEEEESSVPISSVTKSAIVETGAKIEVPSFVAEGDIVKVDTRTGEFIQRI